MNCKYVFLPRSPYTVCGVRFIHIFPPWNCIKNFCSKTMHKKSINSVEYTTVPLHLKCRNINQIIFFHTHTHMHNAHPSNLLTSQPLFWSHRWHGSAAAKHVVGFLVHCFVSFNILFSFDGVRFSKIVINLFSSCCANGNCWS